MRIIQFDHPSLGRCVGILRGQQVCPITQQNPAITSVVGAFHVACRGALGLQQMLADLSANVSERRMLDYREMLESGLVLQINGGSPIAINSNAPFTFPVGFMANATYDVEVRTQPPGQNCRLANNRGTITSGNVTNISVACLLTGNAYQVSYFVTGLAGTGLILTDGFALGAGANGQPAAFINALAEGSQYAVSVVTQPSNPAQTCLVTANGSGTVSRSSITNPAQIVCR